MTHAVAALRSARARVRAAFANLRTLVREIGREVANATSLRPFVSDLQPPGRDRRLRADGTTIAYRATSVWGTGVPSTSSTG